MSWTPPAAPTQPVTIGTNEDWAIFLKVGADYDATTHNPPGATNPDYVQYFNNLQLNPNSILASQIMQDGVEYTEKGRTELDFNVTIWGEENDTLISSLLVAVYAVALPGRASGAIVTPLGAAYTGWFNVGGGTPQADPRGLKGYAFEFTHWGPTTFTPAP
jgi:hypothetical protein